ncbi:MAG: hypothetical protein QXI39_05130 [Candidatus Bathyarchaeia archaeon]
MPGISITSYYGDKVNLMVNHGGKIDPGKHQVKMKLTVDWESYETSIEDEVK